MQTPQFIDEFIDSLLNTVSLRMKETNVVQSQILKNQEMMILSSLTNNFKFNEILMKYYRHIAKCHEKKDK